MGRIRPINTARIDGANDDAATVAGKSLPVKMHSDEQYRKATPYDLPMPMYIIGSREDVLWKSFDYQPGRIVLGSHCDTFFRPDLDELLCTQDVLFAPMYEGTQYREGPFPLASTRGYDYNVDVLREVAPQVRGILVGNRYAEFGCCQVMTGPSDEQRDMSSRRICAAVRESGDLIRSCGGRPVFMFVDYQIILDCYWAPGQPLRAVLQDLDAIVGVLLGFKFWPRMKPLYDHDPNERILPKRMLDGPPYREMKEWLSGLEAWAGVDYLKGLMLQHAQRVFDGGFKAGIIGQLTDGTM